MIIQIFKKQSCFGLPVHQVVKKIRLILGTVYEPLYFIPTCFALKVANTCIRKTLTVQYKVALTDEKAFNLSRVQKNKRLAPVATKMRELKCRWVLSNPFRVDLV